MEIQATLLSNLLNGHHVRETPAWLAHPHHVRDRSRRVWIFFRIRRVALASLLVVLLGVFYLCRSDVRVLPLAACGSP